MIKYIIIFVNVLALALLRTFLVSDVSVKMDAPAKVKQGEAFTVSITINKGSIAGVGHMKQQLPAGFGNAVVVEAKGAEFKYLPEDNVVKFTWISLPADPEFTVSYKITPDATMPNGNVELSGKFSYVLNNEKQTYEVPNTTITVGGEEMATTTTTTQPETTATTTATQPETTAVATKTTSATQPETTATTTTATQPETTATSTVTQPETTATTTTATQAEKSLMSINATRTIVGVPEAGMEFTVEINVKKDGIKGFARIQETLPDGLTAMSLENKGGTFSFLDQKVKIIWDNLPADEDIKVSYRVSVSDKAAGKMNITGSFSYVENDNPMKAEIPPSEISVAAKAVSASNNQNTNQNQNSNNNNNTTSNNNNTTANNNNVPTPETKVNFKVQICALSKLDRSTSYFESKYAIPSKVNMEFHEGFRKYVTGKYTMYKDARDYREKVRSKGVENPFVTAYSNGKRVTVQEGLMVSSQKWIP